MDHLHDLTEAIGNKTVLLIAGREGDERLAAIDERCSQLAGMLELARRIPAGAGLVGFLEAHREGLRRDGERLMGRLLREEGRS